MNKIKNTPESRQKPTPHNGIFERSENIRKGPNAYTDPNPKAIGDEFVSDYFRNLRIISKGVKGITIPEGEQSMEEASAELADTILVPPSALYSDILPPEGEAASAAIESLTKQQFIQQFYEAYMVPVGTKDCTNRLGQIVGNVEDLHSLYPNGVRGLIAEDANASWKTMINFSFTVDEGLGTTPAKYSSLGFPPFVSHDAVSLSDYIAETKSPDNIAELATDKTFDIENVLYKRGKATFRYPAFKQVNDNINLLQTLLNRAFGIESTYMNEWDLSMYMQEGLMSFTEKVDANGDVIRCPNFITTLTYGLMDDAPTEILQKTGGKVDPSEVDLDMVTPFAAINCAVSSRYAIDDTPLGKQANDLDYIIADYPLSAYWFPRDSGANDWQMNVSAWCRDMFAYHECGQPFNEDKPTAHYYTPDLYHGTDFSRSKRPFSQILGYADDRYALLSGWNSTDNQGKVYIPNGDHTNENTASNCYSYLPFWKLFFTNDEDGFSDLDKYLQELAGADKETSILDAAYQIIDINTEGNDAFLELKNTKREEAVKAKLNTDDIANAAGQYVAEQYGADDYTDYKVPVAKFTIKGSKLLKMFLNKSKSTSKAKAAANKTMDFDSPEESAAAGSSASPSGAMKAATPSKSTGQPEKVVVNGVETEVDTYTPQEPGDLCNKKSVGDGIACWSPFLYGGPHGKFLSPLTLEGYTQFGNATLANVPTVDPYHVFKGGTFKIEGKNLRGLEFSKNFKHDGTYIDTVTVLTPNERETVLKTGMPFGVKNMGPNTKHWSVYYSNLFYREYFWQETMWIKFKIFGATIRIPNYWYFKTHRVLNNRWDRWLGFTYDYGTGNYLTRIDTGRWEYDVSVQEDWTSEDFRLIPTCGWTNGWNIYDANTFWDNSTTKAHINDDTWRFRQPTEWWADAAGNINYGYRPETDFNTSTYLRKKWGVHCVKYLIAPVQDGADIACGYKDAGYNWIHYATYSKPGTKWYNQLRDLWTVGTRECTMTVPIVDANNNQIANICCGTANIYRDKVTTWRLVLVRTWHVDYRRHGCSWCCPHRRCEWWWRWEWRRTETYSYNMYFRPDRLQYSIPTGYLLKKEARYSDQRDLTSSNIIERWNTDGKKDANAKRFTSISSGERWSPVLFPFTLDFMDRYGRSEPWLPLPGATTQSHARYAGDLRILHSKGLYYGDIVKTYRQKGVVECIKKVKPVYETWIGDKTYTDTAAGSRTDVTIRLGQHVINIQWLVNIFDFFFGRWYEKKSRFNVTNEFFWTAYLPDYVVDEVATQWELTNIFNESQTWPTVQVYQEGRTPYMTWYHPKDTIGVFIDTCKVQLAWLREVESYADMYLTDALIYDLYTRSVDKQIQSIIKRHRAGEVYGGAVTKDGKTSQRAQGVGGWTTSFSEDINYHDALAIVERVFNTRDQERNTIKDLTAKRIRNMEGILKHAEALYNGFDSDVNTMYKFIRLVTNTRSLLDCAVTNGEMLDDKLLDYKGNYCDVEFPINSSTTYNLLKNPGVVLWAYINVLYQVRRYWVNMRMNKRAGSYWQLRALERVLAFVAAENTAEDNSWSAKPKSIPDGSPQELKNKPIVFVQTRDSFNETVKGINEGTEPNPTPMTKAVYVKVNYLGTPKPEKSSKWNPDTKLYDGDEIVWVNEAYKYARKPQDGLYYVMSKAINVIINNSMNLLKESVSLIIAKQYKTTEDDYLQVKNLLKQLSTDEWKKLSTYITPEYTEESAIVEYDKESSVKPGWLQCIEAVNPTGRKLQEAFDAANKTVNLPSGVVKIALTIFTNKLMEYKRAHYLKQINDYLFPVYIKWTPEQTWSGLTENDENGDWHIDEWQLKETADKERTVTDLYGNEHKSSEAISAGITFDVAAAIDAGTLLSSPKALKDSSLLEILCSSLDNMDLWRIQIPDNMDIPATVLAEKPTLVPAYQIDTTLNGLANGTVSKSTRSVLAGVATNLVLPILEPTEDMVTINTLAALGEFKDISEIGLSPEALTSSGN